MNDVDPAGQFVWFKELLTSARDTGRFVRFAIYILFILVISLVTCTLTTKVKVLPLPYFVDRSYFVDKMVTSV